MPENKIRVLLIEDNLADAELIQRMLAKSKLPVFDVLHLTGLNLGLKALSAQTFDVVLVDLGLPDSSGPATVARVRAANNPPIPTIILTVVETPQTVLEAIKLGAQDYFVKSRLDGDELVEKIIDSVIWRQVHSGGPLAASVANRIGGRVVRLLVIEDDDADASLLRKMLSAIKLIRFEIVHKTSLEAGLTHLAKVDIVLLDLNLPDSTGLETLRRLRRRDAHTPVVLLTGNDNRQLSVSALKEGAQDYLLKDQVDASLIGHALLRQLKKP
jgi:DNA-binding response OmpR family regulator